MDLRDYTVWTILLSLALLVCVEGERRVSREDLEIERQLKHLNKPAIKTIKDKYGDVVDCVDIYKQPAFDHSLLINHTIKMRPSTLPKLEVDEDSSVTQMNIGLKGEGCPPGSVPIRRIEKEDLLRLKRHPNFPKGVPTYNRSLDDFLPQYKYHLAVIRAEGKYYGTEAILSLWGPNVSEHQYSSSQIWITGGHDELQVGWTVNPMIFGDKHTHLYASWSAGREHCIFIYCRGFVQVSQKIALGSILEPVSVYAGASYEIHFRMFKDGSEGHWWLLMGPDRSEPVGYWPGSLFSDLQQGGSVFTWGGEVYYPDNEPWSPMGSSHFPEEMWTRASYISQIRMIDRHNTLVNAEAIKSIEDEPRCYRTIYGTLSGLGSYLYFGGPGNCTG